MAHYDDDTKKFIEDVSRNALGVARDISRKRLPESLARKAVGQATKHVMNKEAATNLNAIKVFEELNSRFGSDWQDWEPETLWDTTGYRSTDAQNMVMALQVICKTNFPFEDWSVFERIVHALNGNDVHFNELVPGEIDHVAWAIKVLQTIRPEEQFSGEVCAYMVACAQNAGLLSLPPKLFPVEAVSQMGPTSVDAAIDSEISTMQAAKIKEIEEYVQLEGHV